MSTHRILVVPDDPDQADDVWEKVYDFLDNEGIAANVALQDEATTRRERASKDLLAALEAMLFMYDTPGDETSEQARAAIAKATTQEATT